MKKVLLLLFLLYPFAQTVYAKEFLTLHLMQKDGLPSNTVYDIYQDEKGCMWFATDKGVSVYDGLNFRNFTMSDGLPSNASFYFRRDAKGSIWVGTESGGPAFYKDGKWHNAKNTPSLQLPANIGQTRNITTEKDGSLTFNFSSRQIFASFKNNQMRIFDLAKCSYLKKHNIPIGIEMYCVKYVDAAHYKLVYDSFDLVVDHKLNVLSNTPHRVLSHFVYLTRSDAEYYYSENKLIASDYTPGFTLPGNFLLNNNINRFFEHNNDRFLCTNHGILLQDDTLFKNINVTTICIDKDGYYWVSTDGQGVYKLNNYFRHTETIMNCYTSEVNFAHTSGNILFFCATNQNFYRLKNNRVECLNNYEKTFGSPPKSENIGHIVLNNSYFNFNSQRFIKLENISSSKPLIQSIDQPIDPFKALNINKAFIADHSVVLNGRGNLYFFKNTPTNLFEHEWKQGHYKEIFFDPRYNGLYRFYGGNTDRFKYFWSSSFNGMYKLVQDSAYHQPQFGQFKFNNFLFAGQYFIGITLENQLLICNNYDSKRMYIDSSIVNDCIWDKLYTINDSTLLVSTNDYYRTIALSPSDAKPVYTLKVLENQFVPQLADFFYSDGTTSYFFKDQSLYSLPVKDLLHNDPIPENHFTSLKSLKRTIPINNPLTLDYTESRDITIGYSTVSLYSSKVSYEYSLSTDKSPGSNWQTASPGSINLLNIGYGTYTLRIRVKTYGGSYSKVQSLQFTITKPYWLQWWFLTLMGIFVCLVAALIILYFIRRKAAEKEKEIRFLKSEFTALNALMNPHFVFNSLNSVQSLINKDEKQAASEYVRVISDLIRQNMYNISSDLVSLDKEMILVENYLKLEKLRFGEIMDYTVSIDDSVDMEMIMVPPLLIQPLVENAVKYGIWQSNRQNGLVEVTVYHDGDSVYIDITDNGPGFATAKIEEDDQHQSTAINNIQKRLEQLSIIHKAHFTLSIEELKDENGAILGVRSRIHIA